MSAFWLCLTKDTRNVPCITRITLEATNSQRKPAIADYNFVSIALAKEKELKNGKRHTGCFSLSYSQRAPHFLLMLLVFPPFKIFCLCQHKNLGSSKEPVINWSDSVANEQMCALFAQTLKHTWSISCQKLCSENHDSDYSLFSPWPTKQPFRQLSLVMVIRNYYPRYKKRCAEIGLKPEFSEIWKTETRVPHIR